MKILMTFKHYPVCGGNYFRWAMEELGHDVCSVGYFSGSVVPWAGNPEFPQYIFPPDIALDKDVAIANIEDIVPHLPWKPDLILQIDAGFHVRGKIDGVPNAMFATDPHFLSYHEQYSQVDFFFNPQPSTFEKYPKSIFLPWAYDPNVHKPNVDIDKIYDIVFIGLMYKQREAALNELAKLCKVYAQNAGTIYDECTRIYNQGRMSFNWSSNDDIPMRVFEGMAYGTLVISNRLTGMDRLFKEDKHYIGYDNMDELVEKVKYLLSNPKRVDEISMSGYMEVEEHTYKNRCKTIIKTIFGHG